MVPTVTVMCLFSRFGQKFINEKLQIPGNKRLPNYNNEGPMPHVIVVAHEAFPLLHNLMRPYPRYRESHFAKTRGYIQLSFKSR